jgi:hypothetical protein
LFALKRQGKALSQSPGIEDLDPRAEPFGNGGKQVDALAATEVPAEQDPERALIVLPFCRNETNEMAESKQVSVYRRLS